MRITTIFLVALSLSLHACGDDGREFTWGDAAEGVAESYCAAMKSCFPDDFADTELCVKHNVYHLCGLEETCDVELPEAEEATLACREDLDGVESDEACFLLGFFGALPQTCIDVLDMSPEGE